MLFYPLLDRTWQLPIRKPHKENYIFYFLLITPVVILSISNSISNEIVILSLFLAAIPEEWFFRAYFQHQMQKCLYSYKIRIEYTGLISIVITSILFASLHAIIQSNLLLLPLVFIPSLIFGYLYLKYQDIVLLVLLHLLSNTLFYWITDSEWFNLLFDNF